MRAEAGKLHSNSHGVQAEMLQGEWPFAGVQALGNSCQDVVEVWKASSCMMKHSQMTNCRAAAGGHQDTCWAAAFFVDRKGSDSGAKRPLAQLAPCSAREHQQEHHQVQDSTCRQAQGKYALRLPGDAKPWHSSTTQ